MAGKGWCAGRGRKLAHDISSAQEAEGMEEEEGKGYEPSEPLLSGVLPPAKLHPLPKQRHQLGTKCSNT